MVCLFCVLCFFFFNDTATTEIYTLSLHDALPIYRRRAHHYTQRAPNGAPAPAADRKSTRLNSSHVAISYAVFCLKKTKKKDPNPINRNTTKISTQQLSTNHDT